MKNEKFAFPPENADLAKYQRDRTVRPLVFTAVWALVGVALLCYLLLGDVDLGALDTTLNKLLMFAAFIGVGVYLIKPYRAFIYRNREGVAGKSINSSRPAGVNSNILTVERKELHGIEFIFKPNNDIVKLELDDDNAKLATDYYHTGSEVRQIRCFKYPYKLRKSNEKYCVCIVCGFLADSEKDACPRCGHSLLK